MQATLEISVKRTNYPNYTGETQSKYVDISFLAGKVYLFGFGIEQDEVFDGYAEREVRHTLKEMGLPDETTETLIAEVAALLAEPYPV